MANQSQTAKNSKTQVGDTSVQINYTATPERIEAIRKADVEAMQIMMEELENRGDTKAANYWKGRMRGIRFALNMLRDDCNVEIPE